MTLNQLIRRLSEVAINDKEAGEQNVYLFIEGDTVEIDGIHFESEAGATIIGAKEEA